MLLGARLFTAGTQAAVVPPGEALALDVSFAPDRVGRLEEVLWIESNDPTRARVGLHLRGSGTAVAPRPALETSVGALDFGPLPACGASERWLEISNRGSDELTIASVTASPPFSAPNRGFRLAPGRFFRLPVAFSPTQAGPILSPLLIHSNDPRSGLAVVSLIGEGGAGECTQKGTGALAGGEARAGGVELASRSRGGSGATRERSRPAAEAGEAPAHAEPPADAARPEAPAQDSEAVAAETPTVREGSFVDVGTYRADITTEHVASVRLDAASGQLALERLHLPVVELPFDQFFDFEPSDAAGSVNELGDVDLRLPVAIVDEEGNASRFEVALTTGTAANLGSDGTLVTLAGEPLGVQGDATLVGLATLPSGGLAGAMLEIVLNVHVEP
jgi:hypothetical protein